MELDIEALHSAFDGVHAGRKSRHAVGDRLAPSLFQYDYLALSRLAADVSELIARLPDAQGPRRALDLGADKSPYRALLEARGFEVRTLDVTPESGADYVGTAEASGLPDRSFDLVLCTQVLEHCDDPWAAAREIRRILRPGGHCIATAPHVWFYHPHPKDHWRFTQEGLLRLCAGSGLRPIALLAQGGSVLALGQILNFLLYGIAGRLGAPAYALVNGAAAALDRVVRNQLFCHNFAVLALADESTSS